ncbi:MAG: Rib/alpha-like domain-containing protein [Facklamia hominis]
MVGKNNIDALNRKSANKVNRYGIRRLSVGVASVAVAGLLFMSDATLVQAAGGPEGEVSTETSPAEESSVTETPAEEEPNKAEDPFAETNGAPDAGETSVNDKKVDPLNTTEEQPKEEVLADYKEEASLDLSDDKVPTAQRGPQEEDQSKPAIATRDAAAPEDTATDADAKNAVHGFVGVLVGGDINADLKAETGQRFKPIEGVKVYFQWYEAKGNRTSPTYFATSGADGQFHIKAKPYIGQDGKLVKFDADTTSSAGSESYKMWVDESTIPEGYQLQYSTGEGVEFNERRVAGGGFQLDPNRLVNYRVLLMKKQDEAKMHKEATPTTPQIFPDPVGNIGQGAVRGKVSWDYESAGGVQWGIVSTPTSPADGITVTASYLSDYALKQIYSVKTANMLGLSKPSDIRGSGWTFKNETQLQEWIAEQVAADKDKWIAETVSAVTNAEGDYKIQFKGTWGPERNDSSVANSERVAGKFYAKDGHTWTQEEVDRLGTVAEHADEGSFLTGALNHNEKHVNTDWLFISTKDTDDVVKRTPWNYNWYTGSNNAWGIHGGWAQAAFGVSTVQAANSTRADFNLAPAEIKFNITNFDTQKNTAAPGDVAKTNTQGLPYKNTNDSFKIVWYDQDGNKIKEEPTQKPTSTGALAEATYDTTGVTETKTFIAKLHYVKPGGGLGQVLAQDAFTVKVGRIVVSAYDDVNIANPAANDKSMEGATYSAEGLPEGLTIDEKTGTVSGKAKVPGKYTVTVTTSILDEESGETMEATSNYTSLVTDSPLEHGEVGVEYKKTVKPAEVEGYVFKNVSANFIEGKVIEGLTITGDQISGTPKAEVAATQEEPNVEVTYDIYKLNSKGEEVLIKEGHKDLVPLEITKAAAQAPKYEPAYADTDATPGTEVTTDAPKFLDQKSTEATKPEAKPQPTNVKFALGDGAPQGATIDAITGAVTYTPTARDANTTVDIPVKVTYSDGTIDETFAKIKVGQAQVESYQPEYTEADAKAGTQTTITAPNFTDKDGQPAAKPEGAKFTLAKDAPTDATINEGTGEITYKPSIDQAGHTVNIPVIVTYKDGSTDEVKAPVRVAEADNLNYEPDYKSVVAQVAHPVTVEAPKFLDKENKEAIPQPTGMTFAIEEGFTVNGNIEINSSTGEITYTAVDADKNTVIEVPVIVTYADGSKESVKAKIDVPSDANFYDPKAKPLTTEQGTVPVAKDGVEFEFTPPADTKFEWEVQPPVSKAGETSGLVKITYPDGTTDTVEVPVTVTANESTKTIVDGSNIKPVDPTDNIQSTGITVTNPDDTTKVSATDANGESVPAVINKETGQIEVTPGTDAKGPITVTVTDDDFPTEETFKVPVKEKSATPVITEPKAGDQTISGTGIAGSQITLAIYGGEGSEDTQVANNIVVGQDGTWTANVPAGVNLNEYDIILATQTEQGKSVSDEARVAVQALTDAEKNNPEAVANPIETEVGKVPEAKNGIANIGELDNVEGVVWLTNPDVSKVADNVKGTAVVVYKDGSIDKVEVPIKVVDKTAPVIDKIGNQTVVEGKPIADVTVTTDDPEAKISIEGQPDGVTVEGNKISGTPTVSDWGKDEEKDFTVKVTAEDEAGNKSETEFAITVQRDTDGDGTPDIYDNDDDGDGVSDEDEKKAGTDPKNKDDKPADKDTTAPKIDRIGDQTVVEKQPIKEIEVKIDDPEAEITVDGLPDDVTYDKDTKKITGSPEIKDWDDSDKENPEEVREVSVKVTAKDKAGNESTEEFTITVQRDTDGDGTPDIYDKDDDGDGVSDEDEKKAGTDPKNKDDKPADKDTTAPKIDRISGQTVVEKQPIKEIEVKTDDPEAEITVDGLPDGVTYDKDSKKITGSPEIKDWDDSDKENPEEVREVSVKVTAKDKAGNESTEEFTITVQRDTDGDGTPDIYDKDDDGDGVDDDKEKEAGTNPKDKDSKPETPAEKDTEAPKIDRIGDQTVVEKQPIKEIEVKTDDPEAEITVDGLPNGVTFDKDSKKITGSPEIKDWDDSDKEKLEEVREVKVKVTAKDKDGNESTEEFTITVQRDTDGDGTPDIYDKDDDGDGVDDDKEKEAGTNPKDKDSKPETPAEKDTTAPKIDRIGDQTVVEKQPIEGIEVKTDDPEAEITVEGLPNGVTFDKDSKKITGSPELTDWNDTDKDNPEEVREVKVTVKAKDKAGNESEEHFTITVQRDTDGDGIPDVYDKDDDGDGIPDDKDNNPKVADKTTVDETGKKPVKPNGEEQGTGVKVENSGDDTTVTATDKNGKDVPATIDPETGEIKVTPGKDVEGPITVVVTDKDLPDGKTKVEIEVEKPEEKDTTAPKIDRIGDQTVVEKQPIEGIEVKTDDPEAEITVDGLPNGVTFDKDSKKITGSPEIKDWNDDDKENPEEVREVSVKVTAKDKAGNESTEEFTITVQRDTDGDGTPDIYDKDDDGDGVSDEDEKKAGTDPKNKDDKPADKDTTAPKIDRIGDQTVVEKQPIKDIEVKTDDPEAEITVDGLPNGVTFDKDSNKITGKPEITDWSDDDKENPEEVREVPVKVTAKDKAGNESTEEFTITVQRDTDGDGTPDIYDNDDDGDGVSDEDEKNKETDPKDKDSKPEEDKTSVDSSNVTPVDPTNDKQSTGIKVENPDKDTTEVTATDEDGNPIPAVINPETGEIEVTPGKNVDGPIKVVITDKDLPDGKVEVEVPVNGHEAGKDDNGSDKTEDGETYVTGTTKPVDPKNEEQETGLVVKNPDDSTEITAKDEDGNDVPARIDENGNIVVTPGENVDGPITVTVTDKDLPNGSQSFEVPVNDHEKGKDDNGSESTDADKITPTIPTEKTGVKDLDNLTDKEKEEVKGKIEDANKDKFPEGTDVSVDDKGKATITYPDGSKDTIPAEDLVFQYEHGDAEEHEKPELPISDIIDPNVPDKTEVDDKDHLTDGEKEDIKNKIEEANKDNFPEGTDVSVDDKGNATITYPDGSKDIIPADQLVVGKDKGDSSDDQTSDSTIADEIDPTIPADKTLVDDKNHLTEDEKAKVKKAIEEANKDKFPAGTKVEIGNDGTATITYPDGSQDVIAGSLLVVERAADGQASGSNEQTHADAATLPQTGENDSTVILGAAALSILAGLGLVASRRKEEE